MSIITEILKEHNKILFEIKRTGFDDKSLTWINEIKESYLGVERNLLLAHVYHLRANYTLDFDDAKTACDYYSKIPMEYISKEILMDYVDSLKLCYEFERVVLLLKKVLETPQWFGMKYFCLYQLADEALVADGIITKEEYFCYKNQCIELLLKEKKILENRLD